MQIAPRPCAALRAECTGSSGVTVVEEATGIIGGWECTRAACVCATVLFVGHDSIIIEANPGKSYIGPCGGGRDHVESKRIIRGVRGALEHFLRLVEACSNGNFLI